MGLRRLDSPKSAGWAGRLETEEEPMLQLKCEGQLLVEISLAWGKSSFGLLMPSTD